MENQEDIVVVIGEDMEVLNTRMCILADNLTQLSVSFSSSDYHRCDGNMRNICDLDMQQQKINRCEDIHTQEKTKLEHYKQFIQETKNTIDQISNQNNLKTFVENFSKETNQISAFKQSLSLIKDKLEKHTGIPLDSKCAKFHRYIK